MPQRPLRACATQGCPELVSDGRCRQHAVQQEHLRPNRDTRRWYYTTRWAQMRRDVLTEAAYQCAACGLVQLALEVDHVVKHDGDPARFWDPTNLQALCAACHTRKTGRGE